MRERSRREEETVGKKRNGTRSVKKSLLVDDKAVDPALAQLFASSVRLEYFLHWETIANEEKSGPVIAPPLSRYVESSPTNRQRDEGEESEADDIVEEDEELSSVDGDIEDADIKDLSGEIHELERPLALDDLIEAKLDKKKRKRKREEEEDGLEEKYMKRLAKEELKEDEERQAERRLKIQREIVEQNGNKADREVNIDKDEAMSDAASSKGTESNDSQQEDDDEEEKEEEEIDVAESEDDGNDAKVKAQFTPDDVPVHETLAPSKDAVEIEKASRTVFLANVSTEAIRSKSAKKALLAHMGSFLDSLPNPPEDKPKHIVESIRFRSTAFAGMSLPKKAAFAKKELMEATTKSTNAYVVYSTAYAAREAVKRLNGSVILDRHLRVDGVAHPSKIDHRRCVFVGNLGFVDDESMLDQDGENGRKRSKTPSDVEEGLWRQFSKAGLVESVRVVRDEKTRVGKGFAYVQFHDPNAVEAALLFNDKKYPPMLPRILRVVRAKAVRKTALAQQSHRPSRSPANNTHRKPSGDRIYNPKLSSQQASLQGRASRLLGKAGAAQFHKLESNQKGGKEKPSGLEGIAKSPETIVFEGFRASSRFGRPKDLKMGGGKKKGKPKTRSSKRAAEWKKSGGRK
ncbi:hypothetical protein B7463_g1977, partial [Scytalidium lignicola]